MENNTTTDTVRFETVIDAAGIPEHASIHDVEWTDDSELEIEWTTEA